jgi:hypothetical protein
MAPPRTELAATSLLATLDHRLGQVQITQGRLRLIFDNDPQLEVALTPIEVAPHPQWEAWQISSPPPNP